MTNEKKIPAECWSRVVGYFRPTNQWNPGKQAEFNDRRTPDGKRLVESMQKNFMEGNAGIKK